MTQSEFEAEALRLILRVRGATKHKVEVGAGIVTASCEIDGRPYELSYVFGNDAEKQRAYAMVIQGALTTIRQHGDLQ